MSWSRLLIALAGLGLVAGCVSGRGGSLPKLAHAVVSPDFDTYPLRRVGLLPFTGPEVSVPRALELQKALHTELAQSTPYELVQLAERDLYELEQSDPHRQGVYKPRTIIDLAQAYHLDGILFGTITQERFFPPLLLSLAVDLVSAETGLVLWSGSVHLDASDARVQDGLRIYAGNPADPEAWRVALISPERFARFAAFQIACLL